MWKPIKPPFRQFKKEKYSAIIETFSFIYQIGDTPMLREPSSAVPAITTQEFKDKLAYLKRCFRKYRKLTGMGVGIAAVQVGIPERFAVINLPKYHKENIVIINPVIIKKSDKKLVYPEMCMSAHPCIAPVVRPAWIEFEYIDEKGEKHFWDKKADDEEGKRFNRVFQHEIDHMDGNINIDHVKSRDILFESDPTFYSKATFTEI